MPRTEQEDLGGMTGPGVEQPRHKDIDRLADKFEDLLEQRSGMTEQLRKTEDSIMEKMKEKGLTSYRYRDRQVVYKPGHDHIKIKSVRTDTVSTNGGGDTEEESD